MPVIASERLDLEPMSAAFLRASLAGDMERARALLGAELDAAWPDLPGILRSRLAQLENEPACGDWLIRAMVLRAERRMVGHVGFHGPPGHPALDSWAPGGVELGYTVYPRDRGRGYATEAARALIDWALRVHTVPVFLVAIAPGNAPSLAVARRLGFRRVGTEDDPDEGPEEILVLERAAVAARRPT